MAILMLSIVAQLMTTLLNLISTVIVTKAFMLAERWRLGVSLRRGTSRFLGHVNRFTL